MKASAIVGSMKNTFLKGAPWFGSICREIPASICIEKTHLGGGNSSIFYVHPLKLVKIPNLTHIFQMGLKPPSRKHVLIFVV